jgi:hypothetical protein
MRYLLKALGSGTLAGLLVVGLAISVARAQSIGGGGGGGGGLTQSAATALYCALAGCTMTGGTTYSGVTTDITTGTNETLTIDANGTGQVAVLDTVNVNSGASTSLIIQPIGAASARLLTAGGGSAVGFSTGYAAVGINGGGAVATRSGCIAHSIVSGGSTPIACGYSGGKWAVEIRQAATCVANAGAGGTLGGVTLDATSSVVYLTNPDADGCIVTMSETSAVLGSDVSVIVVSSAGGVVTFPDVSNVLASPECADTTGLSTNDVFTMHYADSADDLYVGIGCGDN